MREKRILINECRDRILYRALGRNLSFAVFEFDTKKFWGIREKFGSRFLDAENHWDAENYPTLCPIEVVGQLPTDIPFGYKSKELFNWLDNIFINYPELRK